MKVWSNKQKSVLYCCSHQFYFFKKSQAERSPSQIRYNIPFLAEYHLKISYYNFMNNITEICKNKSVHWMISIRSATSASVNESVIHTVWNIELLILNLITSELSIIEIRSMMNHCIVLSYQMITYTISKIVKTAVGEEFQYNHFIMTWPSL